MTNARGWIVGGLVASALLGGCHFRGDGATPFDPPDFIDGDLGGFPVPPSGPPPTFGPTVVQQQPPPPISGGTLTVLADGKTAVAADPDRDVIHVVDLAAQQKIAGVALSPGDEPGRVVEDGAGRVHVALRGGGAVVTLEPAGWTVVERKTVCAAPRGLAYDAGRDQVHVACAGGELVSLPAGGGDATRVLRLDRDLRDVVVQGTGLLVSRFHTAEVLRVGEDGRVIDRQAPGDATSFDGLALTAGGAFRMVAAPDGAVFMAHQRGTTGVVSTTQPGGYGGDPCAGSIVQGAVSPVDNDRPPAITPSLQGAVLPVDVAINHQGNIAVVAAGNGHTPGANRVVYTLRDDLAVDSGCAISDGGDASPGLGQPIALAYTQDDTLVVQSREPAQLYVPLTGAVIALSDVSREDTGHAVFHSNSGAGLACASCHLEGHEDGRTWTFDNTGARRTQSIRGGIVGTEPFHWDGDQHDFGALMGEVFQHRMSGPTLTDEQLLATRSWVNRLPPLPGLAVTDAAAVARGQALFEDAENVGCVGCHAGPHLTNNNSVDVGTDGTFQVPSLRGVAWRPPYLHDGRAATLFDRFGPIGGGDQHGVTSQLSSAQLADLVAYLETL